LGFWFLQSLYRFIIYPVQFNNKFILLTRLTEHANNLSNWLNVSGISSDTLVGNKSTYKDSKVLVGNIGKIGTGFDEAT